MSIGQHKVQSRCHFRAAIYNITPSFFQLIQIARSCHVTVYRLPFTSPRFEGWLCLHFQSQAVEGA